MTASPPWPSAAAPPTRGGSRGRTWPRSRSGPARPRAAPPPGARARPGGPALSSSSSSAIGASRLRRRRITPSSSATSTTAVPPSPSGDAQVDRAPGEAGGRTPAPVRPPGSGPAARAPRAPRQRQVRGRPRHRRLPFAADDAGILGLERLREGRAGPPHPERHPALGEPAVGGVPVDAVEDPALRLAGRVAGRSAVTRNSRFSTAGSAASLSSISVSAGSALGLRGVGGRRPKPGPGLGRARAPNRPPALRLRRRRRRHRARHRNPVRVSVPLGGSGDAGGA